MGALRDSWILLTPQVRVDLSDGARGQVLELIKARLSLCGPWEHRERQMYTSEYREGTVQRINGDKQVSTCLRVSGCDNMFLSDVCALLVFSTMYAAHVICYIFLFSWR